MKAEIYFNPLRALTDEQHKALVGWFDDNQIGLQDGWEGGTTVLDYSNEGLPYFTSDLGGYGDAMKLAELAHGLGVDIVVFCDEHDEPLATEMEVGSYLAVSSQYLGVFEMSACRNSKTPLLHASDFLPGSRFPFGATPVQDELRKALFCMNMMRDAQKMFTTHSFPDGPEADKALEMLYRLATKVCKSAWNSTGELSVEHFFCATGLEIGYHAKEFPRPTVVFSPGREWSEAALERVGFVTGAVPKQD